MNNTFSNQSLEAAAHKTLTRLTGAEGALIPLYLQPDRAVFLSMHVMHPFYIMMFHVMHVVHLSHRLIHHF